MRDRRFFSRDETTGTYLGPVVRVRVLEPTSGIVGGVSLGTLVPGVVYELPRELAEHLITLRAAQQIHSERPRLVHANDDEELVEHITRGVKVSAARTEAPDQSPRRPQRRRGGLRRAKK